MMVSAYTSRGSSWWILQLILQGDYTRYGSIYQKGTPSLENHELSHDDVGKSWLELTEEWKRHKQMLPMGLMEENTVRINPEADFTLFEELRVLALVPPKERPEGDDTTDSIDYQGDAEVEVSGNILICSDNPVFLESILRELSYLENLAGIVVISEVDPEEVNQGRLEVDWIRECSYSLEAFKLAQASDANVAFVDHEHDGLTLIAVLELERISGGTIFTVAGYREDDFDQQLIKAGCDYCINTRELTAPLLSQTSAHPGTGVLIESIISGQPPSERIFSRQFNKKWVPRTWIETLLELKKEYSYLPLGLIRAYDRRMLCNPNNDVMVEPGDTLLFMAKSEEERDLEIFLPGRFALHDPNRKEELDDRQAALLAEAEELFKQGVLLSRKQDGAQEAYQLFHEAAIKGFSRAKYNLGILNFHGKGVPRNVDEAYYWFQEAAVEGNEPARKALDSIKTLRESEEQFKNSEKELNMVQMDHLTEDQRFWYAKAITKMILADGRIDLYERVYLHGAIHILEDPDHVREIEESILLKREINLGNVFGLSDKDQERILNELVEIATVDRDFDIEEQEMLREIGNAMGSSRKSIQKTIDQGLEKVRQYQKR
jgi:Trk K+ transport system NAD-binding subunit